MEETFLTVRAWLRRIETHAGGKLRNVSLIIVGSESETFGERSNADYVSSKSVVRFGMVQSLMTDAARVYSRAARYVRLVAEAALVPISCFYSIPEVEVIVLLGYRERWFRVIFR